MTQVPSGAEVEYTVFDSATECERRVAERVVGDGDWLASNGIVHDLMPEKDLWRVSAHVVTQTQHHHLLIRRQKLIRFSSRDEVRIVDGRNAVFARPTRFDFAQTEPPRV